MEAAVTNKSQGFPSDKKQMLGYGSFEDTMNALEQGISRSNYVCGDQFTAADIYVGSQIGWGLMFGTMDKRPAFEAYVARLRERPAAKRASEADDAAMPEKQA